MLGLTRLYPSPKSKRLVVGSLITLTLLCLIALFDAYFLQRTKSFISPLQRNDIQNCAMTYSYPKYNRVEHVPSPLATKYKLYIYRDGYRDSDTVTKTKLSNTYGGKINLIFLYSSMVRLHYLFRGKQEVMAR